MSDSPKLLLCVEDDQDDRQWIEEAAIETNPKLDFVAKHNGEEALKYLQRQKEKNHLPCLILLDINMPVMDGKETLIALKSDPSFKNIPIIVFTTSNNKADHAFCSQHGVDVITKPPRVSELKRKIQQVVLSRCA